MAWLDWELVLSMHAELLSKLTKLCGKLWNQLEWHLVLPQDKKRANETFFEACGKKEKPVWSRKKRQRLSQLCYPDAPLTCVQRAPGTSGWSTLVWNCSGQRSVLRRIAYTSIVFVKTEGLSRAETSGYPDLSDTCKRSRSFAIFRQLPTIFPFKLLSFLFGSGIWLHLRQRRVSSTSRTRKKLHFRWGLFRRCTKKSYVSSFLFCRPDMKMHWFTLNFVNYSCKKLGSAAIFFSRDSFFEVFKSVEGNEVANSTSLLFIFSSRTRTATFSAHWEEWQGRGRSEVFATV